jgi:RNA-binding protein YhbY
MVNMIQLQIGKKGLTKDFIEQLKKSFSKVENIRISVLKSATRDKKELTDIVDKITKELGPNYTAKIIGYTIILKKWRKPRT